MRHSPARALLSLLIAAPIGLACGGHEDRPGAPAAAGGTAFTALPPVAVPFRWSATPISCNPSFEVRSAADRCTSPAIGEVAVRTTTDAKPAIEIERTGAIAWRVSLPVAKAVTVPVIVSVTDAGAVVVAAAGADAIEVAVLELSTGAVRARGQVAVAGATALQLERRHDGDQLRIHARTASGGVTALLDVVTGSLIGLAPTPTGAIRSQMTATTMAADGEVETSAGPERIWAGWDDDDLVVRAGDVTAPRWRTMLSHTNGPFRAEHVTVHVAGELVVGTIHHPSASWTQVFAVGLTDGAMRWRRTVTGLGPVAHSAYRNRVASRVDGDYLVVQGLESGGTYVCTIELATGRERACVDALAAADVVVPPDPVHLVPNKPPRPRPLGPQVSAVMCRPGAASVTTFSGRRESAVNLMASIVTRSTTCKPTLSGGIAGDRIELTVDDRGPAADAPCECRIIFKQDYLPESQTILVLDQDGNQLVRRDVPGWP